MPITENIISFASQQGGSFSRKELLEAMRSDASINEASLPVILARLVKTGWGEYSLPEGARPRLSGMPPK